MVSYVIKCRQGGDASIARRTSAADVLRLIEQALGQGWTLTEIRRERLVIDEAALPQDALREMVGA